MTTLRQSHIDHCLQRFLIAAHAARSRDGRGDEGGAMESDVGGDVVVASTSVTTFIEMIAAALLESQTLIDEILRLTRFWDARGDRAETVEKKAKTDAELEMIPQTLIIGGVFVSVRPDASLGWRPTTNRTS